MSEKKGDLFARALVLEKDDTRVALVALDFLGWPSVLGDKIRAQVTEIPADNILIAATHTHSAPDAYGFPDMKGVHGADLKYLDWVCTQAVEAIHKAWENRTPAQLKIRVSEAKGKIAYNYYAPKLYDPRCGVIQVLSAKGKNKGGDILATLVNYASHPEVIGAEEGILSPDFCGPLYDRIEEKTGGMALYFNGAQGGMITADNRQPNGEDERTWDECVRIGTLLADEALRIIDKAIVEEKPSLYCATETISFPLDSPIMRNVLKRSPMGYAPNPDGTLSTRLALVNIGSAQLLSIPGEALPNIGYYVKRNMPTKNAFLLGLTNDAFGYMLAKVDWRSFKRYDYISSTGLGEMTGEIYMEQAIALSKKSPKPDEAPKRWE